MKDAVGRVDTSKVRLAVGDPGIPEKAEAELLAQHRLVVPGGVEVEVRLSVKEIALVELNADRFFRVVARRVTAELDADVEVHAAAEINEGACAPRAARVVRA